MDGLIKVMLCLKNSNYRLSLFIGQTAVLDFLISKYINDRSGVSVNEV